MSNGKPIPITIVAGFLGAGKTSLLRYMLSAEHGKKVAVLVNDFGQLNIDTELIVNVEGETVSLTNGCICCSIRDDLLKEVLTLLDQPIEVRPEHIIIETSGVSDPTLVMHTFMLPAVQNLVEVDSVISMVDAEQILNLSVEFRELSERQIRVADLVVINKVDLTTKAELQEIYHKLGKLAPRARVLESTYGHVPIELVFNSQPMAESRQQALSLSTKKVGPDFETWAYFNEGAFSLMAVRKLVEDMPIGVYRLKGFLSIESMPNERAELQMTGGRAWLRLGGHWDGQLSSTALVFIARKGIVSKALIKSQFDSYQTQYSEAAIAQAPIAISNLSALSITFNEHYMN